MFIAVWLLSGVLGAAFLSRSNRAGVGCLLGMLLGPIGVIIAWSMGDTAAKTDARKEAEGSEDRIARAVARALAKET